MTIATYAQLQAAVANWLHRTDLTAAIPDFIALAEARIARDLRTQRMVTTEVLAATAGVRSVALPTGWLEFSTVSVISDPDRVLSVVSTYDLDARAPESSRNAMPAVYAIEGDQMLLGPVPDADYSLRARYYKRLAALSNDADTNWLLTDFPGVYLFGALAESAPFLQDDRVQLWEAKYVAEVSAVKSLDQAVQFSGSPLRVRAI